MNLIERLYDRKWEFLADEVNVSKYDLIFGREEANKEIRAPEIIERRMWRSLWNKFI